MAFSWANEKLFCLREKEKVAEASAVAVTKGSMQRQRQTDYCDSDVDCRTIGGGGREGALL